MNYDPRAVLRDLKSQRDELDTVITYFERLVRGVQAVSSPAPRREAPRGLNTTSDDQTPAVTPPKDAFEGMSNPEAVKAYLRMAGQPQTPKQIVNALKMGGTESEAEKFYSTIYTTLRRLGRSGELKQAGDGGWKLAERTNASPADELSL